ncbi:hypothetical protein [Streptomyces sp. NPDC016626]|uniref:hypothetical protein n=1 Tax=Streptomyces sp. NPDC016626 TaxID=3364968 RepID=UPI0036F56EE8
MTGRPRTPVRTPAARRGGGGRETRVGVHRLFPLPVHAVPFGRDYAEQALAVARPAAAG